MSDEWGAGPATDWQFLSFPDGSPQTIVVSSAIFPPSPERTPASTRLPIFFGNHPHGRRDNSVYAAHENGEAAPCSGHRCRRRVEVREFNYFHKGEIRGRAAGFLYLEDVLVYGKQFGDAQNALLWFATNTHQLLEHPVNFLWSKEGRFPDLIGRKVYWRFQPGVVTEYFADQGAAIIRAATENGSFAAQVVPTDEPHEEATVKEDILSNDVWWFRRE